MADGGGTPLWLTLFLQVVTVAGTHFFARSREKNKRQDDILREWRKSQQQLLSDCVDFARDHYVNPAMIAGTAVSAAKIMDRLRRFRAQFGDVLVVDPTDSAEANRLFIQLNDLITGPEDFQDPGRGPRALGDPIFDSIRGCEEAISRNLKKPRKVKS